MLSTAYIVAIISLLTFSFGDTIGKKVSTKYGNYLSAFFILSIGCIPLLIATLLLSENLSSYSDLCVSVISGLFLAAGYVLVYRSLETEQVTNTWVLLSLAPAALILFGVFVLKEYVSFFQIISIIAIFLGILLVTITKELKFNKMLIPALIGNLSWVVFLVLVADVISTSSSGSTLIFLISRVSGTVALFAYLIFTKKLDAKAVKMLKKPDLNVISSALFDGIGQVALAVYITLQFLALGAAVNALEPGIVSLLGIKFYKEKLTRVQMFGIIISVMGAVAIGLL